LIELSPGISAVDCLIICFQPVACISQLLPHDNRNSSAGSRALPGNKLPPVCGIAGFEKCNNFKKKIMDLSIRIDSDSAVEDAALLQKFIAKQNLEGVQKLEMERAPHQPGEQGLGKLLGNVIINLTDGLNVFKEFLTQLNVFAVKYDRRIHLGDGVVIPTSKLTGEQIERIAIEAMKKGKE
jgi:hypothetical protein